MYRGSADSRLPLRATRRRPFSGKPIEFPQGMDGSNPRNSPLFTMYARRSAQRLRPLPSSRDCMETLRGP